MGLDLPGAGWQDVTGVSHGMVTGTQSSPAPGQLWDVWVIC